MLAFFFNDLATIRNAFYYFILYMPELPLELTFSPVFQEHATQFVAYIVLNRASHLLFLL